MTKYSVLLFVLILFGLGSCSSGSENSILEGVWDSQCVTFDDFSSSRASNSKVVPREIIEIDVALNSPYSFKYERVYIQDNTLVTLKMYDGLECNSELIHFSHEIRYKFTVKILSPVNHLDYIRLSENVSVTTEIGRAYAESRFPFINFELNKNHDLFDGEVNNSFYDIFVEKDNRLYFSSSPSENKENRSVEVDKYFSFVK